MKFCGAIVAACAATLVFPATAQAVDSVSSTPSSTIGVIGALPPEPGHKSWDGADRAHDMAFFTESGKPHAIVVGKFNTYIPPGRTAVKNLNNLVIINMTTGNARATGLQVQGEILTVKISSGGTAAYIGGNFTLTDDGQVRQNAAKLRLSDGALYGWNPKVNGVVNDIDLAGKKRGKVLLAGGFTSPRAYFASVSASSGALTDWMKASVSVPQDGPLVGFNLVTNSTGEYIIGTGSFTVVNGKAHSRMFVMKATKERAKLKAWATKQTNHACSPNKSHEELGVTFAGRYKFGIAATGGGVRSSSVCDTVSVWTLKDQLKNDNAKPLWKQYTSHDSMSGIGFFRGYTYAAGHNKGCTTTALIVPDDERYDGLCQYNTKTGALTGWKPTTSRQSSMHVRLVPTPSGFGVSGLGYVGDANMIGGQARNNLAFFPA